MQNATNDPVIVIARQANQSLLKRRPTGNSNATVHMTNCFNLALMWSQFPPGDSSMLLAKKYVNYNRLPIITPTQNGEAT